MVNVAFYLDGLREELFCSTLARFSYGYQAVEGHGTRIPVFAVTISTLVIHQFFFLIHLDRCHPHPPFREGEISLREY